MRRIRYSKYVPDPAGEMSLEDLLSALSDYLLQSGFQNDLYYDFPEDDRTLDDLRRAIERALTESDLLDQEMRERLQQMQMDGTLDELIEQLIERMQQEDFLSIDDPTDDPSRTSNAGGQAGENQPQAKFEITDKSLDFLGFKALRDLLGSLGKSSFGRHDTRDMATGIEASGSSKQYEFGDTLNLDITATLSNAIQRDGMDLPRGGAPGRGPPRIGTGASPVPGLSSCTPPGGSARRSPDCGPPERAFRSHRVARVRPLRRGPALDVPGLRGARGRHGKWRS